MESVLGATPQEFESPILRQFDFALQVVLPADLAVGVPQAQGIFGFPHAGRLGGRGLGRLGAAPGMHAASDQEAASCSNYLANDAHVVAVDPGTGRSYFPVLSASGGHPVVLVCEIS